MRTSLPSGAIWTVVGLVALVLGGCVAPTDGPGSEGSSEESRERPSAPVGAQSPSPRHSPHHHPGGSTRPSPGRSARPAGEADPRWRFFTDDRRLHASPWYVGRHRVMIGFGCTAAPYYAPDPRCPGGQGFHHGIDVALPCGTELTAGLTADVAPGRSGTVLAPDAPGAPGTAYGEEAFRIRVGDHDVLVGHARGVTVEPGNRVTAGQRLGRASDSGAPDGCHLHLEVRPAGGDHLEAIDPAPWLALSSS